MKQINNIIAFPGGGGLKTSATSNLESSKSPWYSLLDPLNFTGEFLAHSSVRSPKDIDSPVSHAFHNNSIIEGLTLFEIMNDIEKIMSNINLDEGIKFTQVIKLLNNVDESCIDFYQLKLLKKMLMQFNIKLETYITLANLYDNSRIMEL